MNAVIREQIQAEAKKWTSSIDELGRKRILRRLTQTADPWKAIYEMKDEFSLSHTNTSSALTLLNILDSSVCNCHQHVFDKLMQALEIELNKQNDEKLLMMLQLTIHFFSVSHLKAIPSLIVNNLSQIPEKYINYLAIHVNINDLSLSVRRKIWERHENLFIKAFEPTCEIIFKLEASNRKDMIVNIQHVNNLIGGSEVLFKMFANHCVKALYSQRSAKNWSMIMREVLIMSNNSDKKFRGFGKLNELAWSLDACIRHGDVDESHIQSISSLLWSLALSSISEEVTNMKALHPVLPSSSVTSSSSTTTAAAMIKPVAQVIKKRKYSEVNEVKDDRRVPRTVTLSNLMKPSLTLSKAKQYLAGNGTGDILYDVMLLAVDCMLKVDLRQIFHYPVTDAIAPNYSNEIANPICISDMMSKVLNHVYQSFEEINNDVETMIQNCYTYNGPAGIIAEGADRLWSLWSNSIYPILQSVLNQDDEANIIPDAPSDTHINNESKAERLVLKLSQKRDHDAHASSFDLNQSFQSTDTDASSTDPDKQTFATIQLRMTSYLKNKDRKSLDDILDMLWHIFVDVDKHGSLACATQRTSIGNDERMNLAVVRTKIDRLQYDDFKEFKADSIKMVNILQHDEVNASVGMLMQSIIDYAEELVTKVWNQDEDGDVDNMDIAEVEEKLVSKKPAEQISNPEQNLSRPTLTIPLKRMKPSNDIKPDQNPNSDRVNENSHISSPAHHDEQKPSERLKIKIHSIPTTSTPTSVLVTKIIEQTQPQHQPHHDIFAKALALLKSRSTHSDLPRIPMTDKIRWGVLLLKDPVFHNLACRTLAKKLSSIADVKDDPVHNIPILYYDPFVRIALQLLQLYYLSDSMILPVVDDTIIRYVLPFMLCRVISVKETTSDSKTAREYAQNITDDIVAYYDESKAEIRSMFSMLLNHILPIDMS